jgi:hypothetical protein
VDSSGICGEEERVTTETRTALPINGERLPSFLNQQLAIADPRLGTSLGNDFGAIFLIGGRRWLVAD